MASLRVQEGDTLGGAFPLDRDSAVLGRDASCEGVLAQSQVSQQPARISPLRRQRRTGHGK
jgi:hypothetical protein